MKHVSLDTIYNEIMLLSDSDRYELYNRMEIEMKIHESRKIIAYSTDGRSLTGKQYVEKIEKAIEQAEKGELITDEELQKEVETW